MSDLMSSTRITGIFDTVDSIVDTIIEENTSRYKNYINSVLRNNSNIRPKKDIKSSYRKECPEIDIRKELYRLNKNGLDDKELDMLQIYTKKRQESKEKSLMNENFGTTDLEAGFEKAKKSRYLLANIGVFAASATILSAGIGYLADRYNIEMLNYSIIPLFLGSFIATVPLLLENWDHKVGNLLLPEYRDYMSSGTQTHRQYLRERYSSKMQKYFKKNKISMN